MRRIQKNYFWRGQFRQVKNYIASCHECIKRRGYAKNIKAPIQRIPTADFPFQKCAFDAVGPLVTSNHGNKWIIVISDYFTRYAEAYPVKNIQSSTVAHILMEFISRHGLMQVLYSDRGSNFISEAMNEIYKKLGIQKLTTLAYSPQSNGLVERLNKTLIDSLSHLVSVTQEDWCEHVPLALMAYRNAFHRSIKETPSFLNHGRDIVMPYDIIFSEKERSYSDTLSYAHQLVNKLQTSFAIVKDNLEKAADDIEKLNDSRPKCKQILVGDLVYLHTPKIKIHTSKKFAKLNEGPFRVIKQFSPVNFQIQHVNEPTNKQNVHVNRLIKVEKREIFPTVQFKNSLADEDNEVLNINNNKGVVNNDTVSNEEEI
ncbi:Transposon Tf2-9 polyprotein [Araneus ventricosus]|uniref:RNA-directed DNA polymerase n=1 Tax=Araneus ventricosus TaxID=182803 RepID=A0A4Y2WSK4_ARAVE|nr:Transposon Tf2-9 polyprotein [Araneus ventricosus]GBO39747.1 Transposon Tf2-9 polyprotein [Araneus ventricosus]GBO39748.1 Transposon Tf2-9 polyprotein [Araneus ventricosus]GBO39760.1 Transposon Tf2-9 polyprotein [Araneus ventricosus]